MNALPVITDFSSAAIMTNGPQGYWETSRFAGLLPGDRAGNPFARIPLGALVRLNPNLISSAGRACVVAPDEEPKARAGFFSYGVITNAVLPRRSCLLLVSALRRTFSRQRAAATP